MISKLLIIFITCIITILLTLWIVKIVIKRTTHNIIKTATNIGKTIINTPSIINSITETLPNNIQNIMTKIYPIIKNIL